MTTVPKRRLTPEEYLAQERKAEYKSEYYDGETFAMSGASRAHNLIAGNVIREAGNQLRDRGKKAEHYRKIPSLREYVFIAQDQCHVERFSRQPEQDWLLWETEDLDAILDLPAIGCQIKLNDIYAKVQLAKRTP